MAFEAQKILRHVIVEVLGSHVERRGHVAVLECSQGCERKGINLFVVVKMAGGHVGPGTRRDGGIMADRLGPM